MATTPTSIRYRMGRLFAPKKFGAYGRIVLMIVALLLVATAYMVSTQIAPVDGPAPESFTQQEILQKLVNEGLIPAQSLEPAPMSREEILRDLINRGLIPRQALDE